MEKKSFDSRDQFLYDRIGFDYILEKRETHDFTEYVLSCGGDVNIMRVYETAPGEFKVYER